MKYYEQDLFPTFDQHLAANDGKIEGVDVSAGPCFAGLVQLADLGLTALIRRLPRRFVSNSVSKWTSTPA